MKDCKVMNFSDATKCMSDAKHQTCALKDFFDEGVTVTGTNHKMVYEQMKEICLNCKQRN